LAAFDSIKRTQLAITGDILNSEVGKLITFPDVVSWGYLTPAVKCCTSRLY
jgi:hypothetical protein